MEALGAHPTRFPNLGLAHPVGPQIAQARGLGGGMQTRPWKPEHSAPRFATGFVRASGFPGIPGHFSKSDGYNVVLFAWPVRQIRPEGEPEELEFDAHPRKCEAAR